MGNTSSGNGGIGMVLPIKFSMICGTFYRGQLSGINPLGQVVVVGCALSAHIKDDQEYVAHCE